MTGQALARALAWRARECARLGSPLYGHLLRAAAEDAAAGGPVAEVLAGALPPDADLAWLQDTGLPLRLAGSVHRLVLAGRCPTLAALYPSAGGEVDASGYPAAWEAFRRVLTTHREAVVAGLANPPQTNEPGRAAVLIGGLLHIAARTRLPVRLWEVGASAGLNLRADRFRVRVGAARGVGPPDSPVVLDRPWRPGPTWPVLDAPLELVERRGCDPAPIDPTTAEGELALRAYVWPDQPERHDNLSGAVRLAGQVPAPVEPVGAGEFLAGLTPEQGVVTVVWHSIVRKYVDDHEWEVARAHLARAGAAASEQAPVAHLAFEPRRQPDGSRPFLASLQLWPGEGPRWVARAHPHGTWVRWTDRPEEAAGPPPDPAGA